MKTAHLVSIVITLLIVPSSVRAAETDIVSQVWDYPARSVNEISSWFLKNSTPTPKPDTSAPPQVLGAEDLSGASVIETSTPNPNLQTKLDSTAATLDKLSMDYQLISSETVLLGLNWNTLTVSDVTGSIDKQTEALKQTGQMLDWLEKTWGWSQIDTIKTEVSDIKLNFATVRSITTSSGMLPIAYNQLKSTVTDLESIVSQIGDKSDKDASAQSSLYSKYNQVANSATELAALQLQLDTILSSKDTLIGANLRKLDAQVAALNFIPHTAGLLSSDRQNHVLDLLAEVQANEMLLAQDKGQYLTETWIDQGNSTILYKTLVVNPSVLIRQEVPVKYYLPVELQPSDLTSLDPSLQVKLDPNRKRLYVEGNIVVAAGDTKEVTVESKDLWTVDPLSLESLQSQTATLTDSLAGLPSFNAAVALKGNIDAGIVKIQTLQNQFATPEQRIRSYRQISLLQQDMNNNFTQLQKLSKPDSYSPWQAFTAWKEVAIMVGGTVFLLMGLGMVFSSNTKKGLPHKSKSRNKPHRINVFASGVATSDL